MLAHLRIRHLAIVDDLDVGFQPGLNVITGETGAGKSMLADALNLVLGGRADKSVIRAGETLCQVDATFALAKPDAINALLAEAGLDVCDEGRLLIRRQIAAGSGSRIIVNDAPATVQLLKRLGTLLVDMHGPHEHQSLLDPAFQREVLDAYGHLDSTRDAYTAIYRERQGLLAERRRWEDPEDDRTGRLELLAFQIHELEAADLEATDEEALRQEHTRIANAARILELADGAVQTLIEDDQSAFNALAAARRAIGELSDLLPDGADWAQEIESMAVQARELASAIAAVARQTEADPERLVWIEDRMALLQKLKRKYGTDIPAMLAFLDDARRRHAEWAGRGERLAELDRQLAEAETRLQTAGDRLTQARRERATELAKAITAQLRDLGFAQARFTVDVHPANAPGPEGMDRMDFGFAPNVGEPLRSLREIASSGEISRVMLAVKAVLAGHDRIPVLVFDEIDANVGGEMGNAIGRKLAAVAASHQILCITHLPQVAVHGRTHYVVSKSVRQGRTCTAIADVCGEARAEEIARMLGGKDLTSVALRHAHEMLQSPSPAGGSGSRTPGRRPSRG